MPNSTLFSPSEYHPPFAVWCFVCPISTTWSCNDTLPMIDIISTWCVTEYCNQRVYELGNIACRPNFWVYLGLFLFTKLPCRLLLGLSGVVSFHKTPMSSGYLHRERLEDKKEFIGKIKERRNGLLTCFWVDQEQVEGSKYDPVESWRIYWQNKKKDGMDCLLVYELTKYRWRVQNMTQLSGRRGVLYLWPFTILRRVWASKLNLLPF